MQKVIIVCTAMILCVTTRMSAQSYGEKVNNYIKKYRALAIAEQKRSGVPASITLAQGIHETSAGSSELATLANNHFGIKCKKSWMGETFTHTDDAPDECFRKYRSAEESYLDHSNYLVNTPRYANLFKLSPTDYAAWAIGLRQCGYATNPKYAQVLIRLIEEYKLQEYTYTALANSNKFSYASYTEVVPEQDAPVVSESPTPAPVADTPQKASSGKIVVSNNSEDATAYPPFGVAVKVNGLRAIYAKKGDMPLEYAIKHRIRYERLLEFNEISDRPLASNMYLYLERKHFKGLKPTHIVKEGETLAQIAQYEGMQVKALRYFNQLKAGEEPNAGTELQLQEMIGAKPAVTAGEPAETTTPIAEVPVTKPEYIEKKPEYIEKKEVTAAAPPVTDIVKAPAASGMVASTESMAPIEPAEIPTPKPVEVKKEEAKIETPVTSETPTKTETPPATTPVETVKTEKPAEPYNIANEKAVEGGIKETAKPAQQQPKADEPEDELDALKARFDKVVYAPAPVERKAETPVETKTAEQAKESLPSAEKPREAKKEDATATEDQKFHVVKKGDTAFSIAKHYNITVTQLREWNKLEFGKIQLGQRLRVKP